jgi:hypothetical protein
VQGRGSQAETADAEEMEQRIRDTKTTRIHSIRFLKDKNVTGVILQSKKGAF